MFIKQIKNFVSYYRAKNITKNRFLSFVKDLPKDHFAAGLNSKDPIAPAIEYFLSLKAVRGFEKKRRELLEKPTGPPSLNERQLQWASLCAEMGSSAGCGTSYSPFVNIFYYKF